MESQRRNNEEHMFRTDHFKKQTAIIPLKGFDFSKTDENLFKHSDRMKNLDQIQHDLDSLNGEKTKFVDNLRDRSKSFFFSKINYNRRRSTNVQKNQQNIYQIDSSRIVNTDSIFNTMSNTQKQMVLDMAMRQARNTKQTIDERLKFIEQKDGVIRRHKMEMHRKFTLPFACLIFFFIGAPLGAIIRKGGLGMPVVISVLFFVAYYIIDTMGAKMAREGVWLVYQGIWLSSAILLPLGIFLTYKSATDSAIMNADAYTIFIEKLLSKFKKR
jgi:lipopolysaccharide export system permease protein